MPTDYLEILIRLFAALAAGGLIGLERSYRGRAAGFRTHALVCLASSLLMLVGAYAPAWIDVEQLTLDPTRIAQGIMTGIGFVGAGAIIKEGLTVRGLTTAASIWVTAALGILAGVGMYAALATGVVLTLGTLSVFRWIESLIPTEAYASFLIRFSRADAESVPRFRKLIATHGFSPSQMSYRLTDGGEVEYRMRLRTLHPKNTRSLFEALLADARVREVRISPASE